MSLGPPDPLSSTILPPDLAVTLCKCWVTGNIGEGLSPWWSSVGRGHWRSEHNRGGVQKTPEERTRGVLGTKPNYTGGQIVPSSWSDCKWTFSSTNYRTLDGSLWPGSLDSLRSLQETSIIQGEQWVLSSKRDGGSKWNYVPQDLLQEQDIFMTLCETKKLSSWGSKRLLQSFKLRTTGPIKK